MREKILDLTKRYNITLWKILLFAAILLVFILKFVFRIDVFHKPLLIFSNIYGSFLIAQAKIFLSFFKNNIVFDFLNNQIITNGQIITVGMFYFSLNQILALLIIVLITKSPVLNKIISFLVIFIILSVYNSIRITLHTIYPETIAIHNWFFNLVLIPRWLIVLGFAWYYWKKFPSALDNLKKKFGFTNDFIKSAFIKIGLIVILYYIVVILVFNDYIYLNGRLLVALILKVSKFFIHSMGYDCWVKGRQIYGTHISLNMDDACMGINLMFLFASFIALLPGSTKHKIWYIPLGLIVILLLNCLRIVLIFINMAKTGTYTMTLEIHDLFTYPVLIFTFIMWVIWINKFYKPKTTPIGKMPQIQ